MWQELIAGIIVALAVLYAGAKYLPDSWRRAIVQRLSSGGRQSRLASWLAKRLDTSAACGGGGCNSCSSGAPSAPTPPAGKGKVIKIHERR